MHAVLSSRSLLALATTLPGDTGDPEDRGRHACSSLRDHFAKRCHTWLSTGALTLPCTVSACTVSLLPLAHIKSRMSCYIHTGTHCTTFSSEEELFCIVSPLLDLWIAKMQYFFLKISNFSPKKMVIVCCERQLRMVSPRPKSIWIV